MASSLSKINHVVVLMLENRSFDHLLGFLRGPDYPIDGLLGTEFNPRDPSDPASPRVLVGDGAPYAPDLDPDPNHDVRDVTIQLFGGAASAAAPPPMNGFVYDYSQIVGVDAAKADTIMQSHAPRTMPALTTLAKEFALCDHWFSSVPGPTWPNRIFAHAATSDGYIDNNLHDYKIETIYHRIMAAGLTWRIYFHDIPQALAINSLRDYPGNFEQFDAFVRDCRDSTLPTYSFIEPRYSNFLQNRANDQHPPHGIPLGEMLIADVYDALRNSPTWSESLLVVVWDEHGGMYDHVAPPACVNPDGKVSPEFDFTRLGARVPAVVVCPYIERQTIDHTVYDHTSISATLRERFGFPKPLTRRDAAANTFGSLASLPAPRTDCPVTLPRPDLPSSSQQMTVAAVREAKLTHGPSTVPTSDYQHSLVALSRDLDTGESESLRALRASMDTTSEHSAAIQMHSATLAFLNRPRP